MCPVPTRRSQQQPSHREKVKTRDGPAQESSRRDFWAKIWLLIFRGHRCFARLTNGRTEAAFAATSGVLSTRPRQAGAPLVARRLHSGLGTAESHIWRRLAKRDRPCPSE